MTAQKTFLTFITYITLITHAPCQDWEKYFKTEVKSVISSYEGGFALITDDELIKISNKGDTIWTYKDVSNYKNLIQLRDSNYVILNSSSGISLTAVSKKGAYIWSKTFHSTSIVGKQGYYSTSIKSSQDGGFLLLGYWQNYLNGLAQYNLIKKLNSKFEIEWEITERAFPRNGTYPYPFYNDFCSLPNGYVFLSHDTITKIDLNGKYVWKKPFRSYYSLLHPTVEGGFVLNADSLIKFNADGEVVSSKRSHGNFESWADAPGGYYYGGSRDSIWYTIKVDYNNNLLWSKQSDTGIIGSGERVSTILPIDEFNFLAGGRIYRDKGYGLLVKYNIKTTDINESQKEKNVLVFPNPNSGSFNLTLKGLGKHAISLYSPQGREIEREIVVGSHFQFSIQNINSGIYFLHHTFQGVTEKIKVIVVK